ncbi:MAG: T9SS type A sorting domain-containing protein, partial [Fidelibacterota bacterium]
EADGAQDMGYPSPFLFTDPSSGLWSDMWFAGNTQFYVANPGLKDQPISFGPYTFPDTRSNTGAHTYVEIHDISEADRVMSFTLRNTLMAQGFPEPSLRIRFVYDFDGDGTSEIIGGQDSLWWSLADSVVKNTFFVPEVDSFQLVVTAYESPEPRLAVVSDVGRETLRISTFGYDPEPPALGLEWSLTVTLPVSDRLPAVTSGFPDSSWVSLNWRDGEAVISERGVESLIYRDTLSDPAGQVSAQITDPQTGEVETLTAELMEGGGIRVKGFNEGLETIAFQTISAVDLDLDGEVEMVCTDSAGTVYVLNPNLTYESGFPVPLEAASPVLASDLMGDDHPELVLQVESGDLAVLSWEGKERYRLSNPDGGELRMVGEYQGRSAIVAESSVWVFDSSGTPTGNAWSTVHHDPANTRTLRASLPRRLPVVSRLIDRDRTYAYPNPAHQGTATFRVFVESAEKVDIAIYDLAGFFVEKLTLEPLHQGTVNEVVWNVSGVESGVYLVTVTAGRGDRVENKVLKIAVVH